MLNGITTSAAQQTSSRCYSRLLSGMLALIHLHTWAGFKQASSTASSSRASAKQSPWDFLCTRGRKGKGPLALGQALPEGRPVIGRDADKDQTEMARRRETASQAGQCTQRVRKVERLCRTVRVRQQSETVSESETAALTSSSV